MEKSIRHDNVLGKVLDELWVRRLPELAGEVRVLDLKGKGHTLVPLMLGTGLVTLQAETLSRGKVRAGYLVDMSFCETTLLLNSLFYVPL